MFVNTIYTISACICNITSYPDRAWYMARHSARLSSSEVQEETHESDANNGDAADDDIDGLCIPEWADHINLEPSDVVNNLNERLGINWRKVGQSMFEMDTTHEMQDFDMAELKSDIAKGTVGRVASLKADGDAISAAMLIRNDFKYKNPFEHIGWQWVSCLLGGEGHIYYKVDTKLHWMSFGSREHGALMWGPYDVVTRNDGETRRFIDWTPTEHTGPLWAFLFHADDPTENNENASWLGVPTVVRRPDELTQFKMANAGLYLEIIDAKYMSLVSFVFLHKVQLSSQNLTRLCKEFGCTPKNTAGNGITIKKLVVSLVDKIFDNKQGYTHAKRVEIAHNYLVFIGNAGKDVHGDNIMIGEALDNIEGNNKDQFKDLQEHFEHRRIKGIVDMAVSETRNSQRQRADPEHGTPWVYKRLKPVDDAQVCRLVKDYGQLAFQAYYDDPPDAGGNKHSKWCCWGDGGKYANEKDALAGAVDWMWKQHEVLIPQSISGMLPPSPSVLADTIDQAQIVETTLALKKDNLAPYEGSYTDMCTNIY